MEWRELLNAVVAEIDDVEVPVTMNGHVGWPVDLTRRIRGCILEDVIGELTHYLRGWLGYFCLCETQRVLRDLERWLHRRFRSLMWKRWKRGAVRFRELRNRGVPSDIPH